MSTTPPVSVQQQVNVSTDPTTTTASVTQAPPDPNEVQQLSQMIKSWKELHGEVSTLKEQVREKNKRLKVMEEMILRIMKKNNIGALDLSNSGGRLLYRR